MDDFKRDPKWALAYLRGRAKAFVGGRVPLAALTTAVSLAEKHGVANEEIRNALRETATAPDESGS